MIMKNPQIPQQEQKYNQYKETQYCSLLNQVKYQVDEYTYCIERVYIKSEKQQEELRLHPTKPHWSKTAKKLQRYFIDQWT